MACVQTPRITQITEIRQVCYNEYCNSKSPRKLYNYELLLMRKGNVFLPCSVCSIIAWGCSGVSLKKSNSYWNNLRSDLQRCGNYPLEQSYLCMFWLADQSAASRAARPRLVKHAPLGLLRSDQSVKRVQGAQEERSIPGQTWRQPGRRNVKIQTSWIFKIFFLVLYHKSNVGITLGDRWLSAEPWLTLNMNVWPKFCHKMIRPWPTGVVEHKLKAVEIE